MTLRLRDRVFEVERATLSAAIPDPYWSKKYNPSGDASLFWSLNVIARKRCFDEQTWGPAVYHENLHIPIRRWTDIVGQVVQWDSPCDEQTGEPNGGFYVFEHGDIPRAVLRFTKRDGLNICLKWDGLCNVFWDDKYGQNVPFSIETWAKFTEVHVRGSEPDTNESMRARLAEYLNVQDFVQHPIQFEDHSYEDGIKMVQAVFSPVI